METEEPVPPLVELTFQTSTNSKKNGEVSWRSLGKSCGASIKTDAGMKQIITCNQKHSGVHPVTMRTLLSPLLKSQTVTAASPVEPAVPCTPSPLDSCAIPVCSTPATDISLSDDLPGLRQELDAVNKIHEDPLAEISRLRKEIERLESEYRKLLNHTIESDTRLLEFMDQLFQVSKSRIDQTARASATVDCGVQCEPYLGLPEDHLPTAVDFAVPVHCATQTDRAPTVDSAVQSESSSQPSCQLTDSDVQCELLGPTVEIEVLEAEVQCLKLQSITCEDESMSEQPWTRDPRSSSRRTGGKTGGSCNNGVRHRHDLEPENPIHLETALVNAFIQELAVRYGTRVVDFNRISRQCFTAHGQHLNMSCKRKLAELVVEKDGRFQCRRAEQHSSYHNTTCRYATVLQLGVVGQTSNESNANDTNCYRQRRLQHSKSRSVCG
ncbi:hypothetical protein J6590_093573 [Homalodisca vitripennis]|nr:hypothetical protein J6590_093573 [Homalodisca vitripennis]